MGGKALTRYGVFTERKNTTEFKILGDEIRARLATDHPMLETAIVTCYNAKPDHGDIDLLVKCPKECNIDWKKYVAETFSPQAIYCNGGVSSFDYKNFQVDLIPINAKNWNTAICYFSYDPIGNIMGKTYHKFGLSYGWDGLYYRFRNFHGSNSRNILISTDIGKIFEFGGYDYEMFLDGFETLEEIYKFAINSKFFDSQMFQIESLGSNDRKRNRKRNSYHLFLKYLEDNNINTKFIFDSNKDNYLDAINNYFPEARFFEQLDALKKTDARNKMIASKFSGDDIMLFHPTLQGRELGNAITKFKNHLGDSYDDFILDNDLLTIMIAFDVINNL